MQTKPPLVSGLYMLGMMQEKHFIEAEHRLTTQETINILPIGGLVDTDLPAESLKKLHILH